MTGIEALTAKFMAVDKRVIGRECGRARPLAWRWPTPANANGHQSPFWRSDVIDCDKRRRQLKVCVWDR